MSTLTTPVPLTEPELKLLQTLVYQECGMYFDERRTHFLRDRLQRRLKTCQMDSFYSYYRLLTSREGKQELVALLENLTVNETSFFRIRPQLELFQKYVLETILKRKQERRDFTLRIWSAGCSTGQEPYSLAMIVEDEASKYPGLKTELFGSDLSERCLEKAQSGLYTQFEVQRGLPIRLLVRHFEKNDETWALNPRIRQAVRWRRVNLLADLTGLGEFDVIFCRNVVSSFDRDVAARVLEQLAAALPEDGRLVLGIEETASDFTDALRPLSGRRGVYAPNLDRRKAA